MRALLVFVALLSGCRPAATPPREGAQGKQRPIEEVEDEVLRDLAAIDRRVALRARMTPSEDDLRRVAMAAVLQEDASIALVNGAIDPFSFEARARGLDAAKRKLAADGRAGQVRGGNVPGDKGERELLGRLVEEEFVRLEEERGLPRSASALVRAIVDTWQAPEGRSEAAERDRWLARRLTLVRETMTVADPANALDLVRARELDDALDALERIVNVPGFTTTMQELVRVREALEAMGARPSAKARSDWNAVARRMKAHLGITASPDELAKSLDELAVDLRARAEKAVTAAKVGREPLAALEAKVLASGPCIDAVPGSRIRSMAAPPEREPACHLRHFVANAEDDNTKALTLVAMHDHVVVASWALDVARGAATLAETQARHRLFVPVGADTRARYERVALARPVAAIGAGESVRILVKGDPKAWSALGDVPLDVARRELAR